jgi:hypothetical protein
MFDKHEHVAIDLGTQKQAMDNPHRFIRLTIYDEEEKGMIETLVRLRHITRITERPEKFEHPTGNGGTVVFETQSLVIRTLDDGDVTQLHVEQSLADIAMAIEDYMEIIEP